MCIRDSPKTLFKVMKESLAEYDISDKEMHNAIDKACLLYTSMKGPIVSIDVSKGKSDYQAFKNLNVKYTGCLLYTSRCV